MKHEPGIFEEPDPEAEAAADARGLADIEAGRVYSHEIVSEWLRTWTSPDYKPFHEWFAARNG
jgi:predicted transcriptional regulator